MKTTHPRRMVAHLWANQSQPRAKTANGSFYFEGDTIYSYGTHFPIARHVKNKKGERAVLMTTRTYSVTTTGHCSAVRQALRNGATVFYVDDVTILDHKRNLKKYQESIDSDFAKAIKGTVRASDYLMCCNAECDNANVYAEFFGLKTRFAVPVVTEEQKEKIRLANLNRQLREAARQEKALIEAREKLEEWKKGEKVYVHSLSSDYMRIVERDGEKIIETTRGAEVPLDHALKILPLARSGRHYVKNGVCHRVGHFTIDEIDEQGNIRAGCHFIKRDEVERIAAQLGL